MPANKFSHASTPYTTDDADELIMGKDNPPGYRPPEDAINDYFKGLYTGPAPTPGVASTDLAARLMNQYGDTTTAASMMGVKPRPPVFHNPDIYLGAPAPAAPSRTLRPLAPTQTPNWAPSVRKTGVI